MSSAAVVAAGAHGQELSWQGAGSWQRCRASFRLGGRRRLEPRCRLFVSNSGVGAGVASCAQFFSDANSDISLGCHMQQQTQKYMQSSLRQPQQDARLATNIHS